MISHCIFSTALTTCELLFREQEHLKREYENEMKWKRTIITYFQIQQDDNIQRNILQK